MHPRILITGAAGYIGGAILADLVTETGGLVASQDIYAAVRNEDQAAALSRLGVNVLQLDLMDEKTVVEFVLRYKINIIINTASAIVPTLVSNLITALGNQKAATGEETYFIHTSALSAFFEKTGWPPATIKDTGPVYPQEKALAASYPVRETDVTVIEHAKAVGVTSFIVVPPLVYGRGSGAWNQLSIVLPVYVQAFTALRKVYQFSDSMKVSAVRISDLTTLYTLIVNKIVQKERIPSGEQGYYFALAHDVHWPKTLHRLAGALRTRKLVESDKIDVWPSDGFAAEALGVPEQFLQPLWNAGENIISENVYTIGWQPTWDEARFLENIDDEVKDVLELGKAKSSLIASLFEAAKA